MLETFTLLRFCNIQLCDVVVIVLTPVQWEAWQETTLCWDLFPAPCRGTLGQRPPLCSDLFSEPRLWTPDLKPPILRPSRPWILRVVLRVFTVHENACKEKSVHTCWGCYSCPSRRFWRTVLSVFVTWVLCVLTVSGYQGVAREIQGPAEGNCISRTGKHAVQVSVCVFFLSALLSAGNIWTVWNAAPLLQ